MKNNSFIFACLTFSLTISVHYITAQPKDHVNPESVIQAIDQGIAYFYSINTYGGYVYDVTTDLQERWGENRVDEHTIEVQPPGTPAVGMTFLRGYGVTGNSKHLQAAKDAAFALIRGQNDWGGWEHTINFKHPQTRRVSFDDDQTQSAIRFLMALDQHVDDDSLTTAINKALQMMLDSQLENGGWPHKYPVQGNYHDYATFNDHGINDCIRTMIDAVRYYDKEEYRESLKKAGRFMMISQLPPPQSGWAQQYNAYLQPAWARDFEPPAVCPAVTVNNLFTLMDLYAFTNNSLYLKPIPDAIRWLDEIRLPNGKWARFVAIGTGEALYFDRGRIRVNSTDELHIERRTGYGYESNLAVRLQQAKDRFSAIRNKSTTTKPEVSREHQLQKLISEVKVILAAQDEHGRWVTKNDRFKKYVPGVRWNGEYRVADRIKSSVFNRNINALCAYLELTKER
ncbi:MAG: hypothetical protein DWQ10_18185 [Calditrichaeota bacterium]|nr:MAG: hypothetical protein DWQ10_18185 [Calditrichota bacterium]